MSKKRITPFNEAHVLEYGLEIASRCANNKEVNSVRCKFCISFGKEGSSSMSSRQWKVTKNINYFTKPFQVDNYKSHLKTHSVKWAEYQQYSNDEKQKFFDKLPFVNTLNAHFDVERAEVKYCFDPDIIKKLI
jgi:hypothetical protein